MEALYNNILDKNIDEIHKDVHNLVSFGYKKNDIVSYLISIYSAEYINKNVWTLREIYTHLTKIESKISTDELIETLSNIAVLISLNPRKSLHIYSKELIDHEKIRNILFTNTYKEFNELAEFKDILKEEIYGLLNIIYGNLVVHRNITQTFEIVNYILNCTRNKIFKNKSEIDPIDYIFIILIKIHDNICKEYVILCKDIFYYRCKKPDKMQRVNLLFYSIFVTIHKNHSDQKIDYKVRKQLKDSASNYDYLFIKFNYDKQYMSELDTEKDRIHKSSSRYKDISVSEDHNRSDATIILDNNMNIYKND